MANDPPVPPPDWQGLSVGDDVPPQPDAGEPDYANMPWPQVGEKAVGSLIPSFGRALVGAGQAVLHPIQTAEGIGNIGYGALSKTGIVGAQDPQSKATNEAAFNALAAPYTSIEGFKKALAEDPYSVLSAAAIPLTGGASALGSVAEGLDAASIAGQAANWGSKALGATATVADPVGLAGKVVGKVAPAIGNAVTGITGKTTGAGTEAIKNAASAGAASIGSDVQNAFNGAIKGDITPADIALSLQKAASDWKNDAVTQWKADKTNLMQQPSLVDLDPVQVALNDERSRLGSRALAIPGGDADQAHQNLDRLQDALSTRQSTGQNTLQDIDQFKQDVYNTGDRLPAASRSAFMGVHSAIRDALSNTDPQYSALMTSYQNVLKQAKDLNSAGAGPASGIPTTQVLKAIKAMKNPSGGDLINKLAQYDPTLPYQLSGMALRGQEASGLAGRIEGTGQALGALELGKSLLTGDFGGALKTAAAMGGDFLGQDPHLMGSAAYGIGAASRNLAPVTNAAKTVATPLTNPIARQGVEALTTPMEAQQIQQQKQNDSDAAWGGLPSKFADGGAVDEKTHHRKLVDRLMKLAHEAGKFTEKQTAPILHAPDEAVAKALSVAQRAI